nr:helix-turn-helix transcriptional regulator [uncultured Cellulosilyticum sp.]
MDWIKLGKKIKAAREAKGLSQKDIARLLGVSDAFISQLENGKKKASVDNVIKLSKVLDINVLG